VRTDRQPGEDDGVSVESSPHLVEIVAALKEITARISTAPSPKAAVDELLSVAAGVMPPYVRCGITLITQGEPAHIAAADLSEEVLDETGRASGDGPCLEAVRTRDIVLSQNLLVEPRWPVWAETARRHGFASVLSYPFDVDPLTLGALTIYADRTDAFEHELPIVAMLIADHASLLLRVRLRQLVQEELAPGHTTTERAVGIVMAQRGCPPEQALRHLHEAATHLGVDVPAVAERLVRTVSERSAPSI
jgi:transcriptional regulator with GAF, ATPase, and Fis domain